MARSNFEADGYDIDTIYAFGAKDDQGHSTNLRCKIPDSWAAMIADFIGSKDWPEYRTVQHFIRDAIYHRMHWVQTQDRDRGQTTKIQTLVRLAQHQEQLNYQLQITNSYRELRDQMDKTFRDAYADGDLQAIRVLVADFRASLDLFEDPYRSKLGEELDYWEKKAATL